MRYLLIIFLVIPFRSEAQNSFVDVFNRHKFNCDKGAATLEVNICTREKVDFADSLLNRLWKRKLKEHNTNIQEFSVANFKKRGRTVDSSDLKVYEEQYAHSIRLKQKLISSQQAWLKLRQRNYEYALESCQKGTGCPAIANNEYLNDTLDRIRWLEKV